MLGASLAEISPQYGLLPEAHLVDRECCLATKDGLAAVHINVGPIEEINWVGICLEEMAERGVRGLGLVLRTLNGEFVAGASQQQAYLTDYVPGASCDATNIFEVRAVGRVVGEVHRASEDILYLHSPPAGRVSPSWRQGALERTAYWRLAVHKYRQAARGEALRQLLSDAEESLTTLEALERAYDGPRLISFAHLSFAKFVYVNTGHTVHLNYAHECYVEPNYVSLGELLLDTSYTGDACLHLLAAYQAAYPISDLEWQMLLAYLTYPHEWAQELDDMTRGRPILKGVATLDRLQQKREWLEWLNEHFIVLKKTEKGGLELKSDEKRPIEAKIEPEVAPEEENKTAVLEEALTEQVVEEGVPAEDHENTPPTIEKPKASIVWKPFPRPRGAKIEEPEINDDEQIPT